MTVFDTKRHSNAKGDAEYRRIRRNFKGLERYKVEKARRQRVLELQNQGMPLGDIAVRLGVSVSTVKRDLRKVQRFVKGNFNLVAREEGEAFRREFMSWSFNNQLAYLKRSRNLKPKAVKCRALVVTVDVDAALAGGYALSFRPRLPVELVENARLTVELQVCGRKQVLGRMYVGQILGDSVGLQTNESLNVFVKCVLKDLCVAENFSPVPACACW